MTERLPDRTIDALLAHARFARALARDLVGDAALAEDVVQDAWVAALRSPPTHGPRSWLRTVVRNLSLNARRGRARRSAREGAVPPAAPQPSPADLAERREALRRVTEAVLALEEPYQSTILQRFHEDLPPEAIARRVGIPASTVRSRLRRALEMLRERLDDGHGGEGRRRWAVALLPLARGAEAASAPWTGGAAVAGGLAMQASVKVAVGVALALAGGAILFALRPPGDPAESVAAAGGSTGAGGTDGGGGTRGVAGRDPEEPAGGDATARDRAGGGDGGGRVRHGAGAPLPDLAGAAKGADAGAGDGEAGGAAGDSGAGDPERAKDATAGTTAPADAPMTAATAPETLAGTVLDGETGRPVSGARVLLGLGEGLSFGDTTDDEGRFAYRPRELVDSPKVPVRGPDRDERLRERLNAPLSLTVRARGYRAWSGPPSREGTEMRLERDRDVRRPGTIAGTVTRADGTPFTGNVVVEVHDPADASWSYQWTRADEAGGYALPGVPPGLLRVGFGSAGDLVRVTVPEGGTVRADLVLPAGGPDTRGEKLPSETRDVILTGLPADATGGAHVRAQARFGSFFRVPVEGTTARFAALPVGAWRFVLQRPGQPDAFTDDAVGRGDEPLRIAFGK